MATKVLTATTVTSADNAILPLVGRLMIALIFVLSGAGKLAAPAATIGYIAASGLPLPQLGYALALLVELGGGILLVLGYRTKLVAAVLVLFSLATALAFHNHLADQSQMINFLKNIAMAGGLLFVMQAGAGRISLDARR